MKNEKRDQQKKMIQERINVIENQLSRLDRCAPETYHYLMGQLDEQGIQLARIVIQEEFERIAEEGGYE